MNIYNANVAFVPAVEAARCLKSPVLPSSFVLKKPFAFSPHNHLTVKMNVTELDVPPSSRVSSHHLHYYLIRVA